VRTSQAFVFATGPELLSRGARRAGDREDKGRAAPLPDGV
jgi:hypothetical protein